jgi:hypothetical protein
MKGEYHDTEEQVLQVVLDRATILNETVKRPKERRKDALFYTYLVIANEAVINA